MSLLWRNHLRISLCADRLLVRANKGRTDVLALSPGIQAAEWRTAVDALPGVLSGYRNHDVSLVIADQFVRYTLLAWNAALKSEEHWLAFARHRLAAVHGAAAAEWEVKLTETAPSGPRLACAVDRALLDQIRAVFTGANVRLVSAQPFLVAAFNRIRRSIGNSSCWLLIEEPGRLTLAFIQRGVWLAVRSRRADPGWRAALPEILERESAFLALSERCTRVIVCAQGEFDTEQHDAWHTKAVAYSDLALTAEPA